MYPCFFHRVDFTRSKTMKERGGSFISKFYRKPVVPSAVCLEFGVIECLEYTEFISYRKYKFLISVYN